MRGRCLSPASFNPRPTTPAVHVAGRAIVAASHTPLKRIPPPAALLPPPFHRQSRVPRRPAASSRAQGFTRNRRSGGPRACPRQRLALRHHAMLLRCCPVTWAPPNHTAGAAMHASAVKTSKGGYEQNKMLDGCRIFPTEAWSHATVPAGKEPRAVGGPTTQWVGRGGSVVSMAEEPMARRLPARSTRGKWSSKRAEEDVERDKAFWEQSVFQEEEEDADFDVSKEAWGGSGSAEEQEGVEHAEDKDVGEEEEEEAEEEARRIEGGEVEEAEDDVEESKGEEGEDVGVLACTFEHTDFMYACTFEHTDFMYACTFEHTDFMYACTFEHTDFMYACRDARDCALLLSTPPLLPPLNGADAGCTTTQDGSGGGSKDGEGEGNKRKGMGSIKPGSSKKVR
ncbi:unnamed protein product [Closterium sp. NIES-53]